MFRPHVITAIASRNIKTFFTSVIGYLFIVVFVVVSGIIAFGPKFFGENLATLDQLTNAYPMLLLFLIPAISMGVWSDEKKQGTDAILFTLPASDLEILLGKYISVVVVYAAALAFSLTQLVALATIGSPDWGAIFSTYVGYLFAGSALLSIGMFASSLTSNTTVAFVLGAFFCSLPVFVGALSPENQFLQGLSIGWQLREFGEGTIGLSNVLYFVFLKHIGLFLNYVVITRRHWSSGEENGMYALFGVQVASILILFGSLYFLASKAGSYVDTELDLTMQRVNSLSQKTIATIDASGNKRRVEIQAYVSEEVPTEYVPVKKRLLRLLRQYSQRGGSEIELRVINVAANSDSEREAKSIGIEAIDHISEVAGRQIRQDVYMGVKFSSPSGDTKIPRITPGTPLEYELTRAIGTTGVLDSKIRLGVLESDANFLGIDGGFSLNHRFVNELKKRYDVVRVTTDDLSKILEQQSETKENEGESEGAEATNAPKVRVPDVLLVFRASLLPISTQNELVKYMDAGNPTVITVDALHIFPFSILPQAPGQVLDTPAQRMVAGANGFTRNGAENNDCKTLFDALQLEWDGINKDVTIKGQPPQPSPFGGPPSGGTPDRQARAFYPTIAAQNYRAFDELRFEDTKFEFSFDGEPGAVPLSLGEERNGIPTSLGTPNAMMINSKNRYDFEPFNSESVIASGIDNVLMFYAGALRKKDFKAVKETADQKSKTDKMMASIQGKEPESPAEPTELLFEPIISAEPSALGLPWDEIVKKQPPQMAFQQMPIEQYQIDPQPNFYRFELAIAETEKALTAAQKENDEKAIEKLNADLKLLKQEQSRYRLSDAHFAVRVSGQREKDGNEINAVVISDSDFATNFFFAIADQLNQKPDNVEFVMNIVDSLGGKDEFVELRSRNPKQRTLTYMDKKRDEFRTNRLEEENRMRRDFQEKAKEIAEGVEKQDAQSEERGLARAVQRLFAQDEAAKKLDNAKEKLQIKLDESIEELKSLEAQSIKETEKSVQFMAVFLPMLPALFLGVFVFVYGFIQERSIVNEKRRV